MNPLDARRRLLGRNVYKKTVEGNPAIAQGSLARRYPGITMQGWTEQDSYEGNQLFVASAFSSIYEKGGATVSNNGDGNFTVSGDGTLTETFSFSFALSSELLAELKQALTPGVIHFNAGDVTYPYIQISISFSDGGAISFYNSSVSSIDHNITQEQIDTISEIRYFLYGNVGSNIVPGTMKPMLYQSGDGTFEPYTGRQPSPSPDYPQDIVSAGKYNEETQKYQYQVKISQEYVVDRDMSEVEYSGVNNVYQFRDIVLEIGKTYYLTYTGYEEALNGEVLLNSDGTVNGAYWIKRSNEAAQKEITFTAKGTTLFFRTSDANNYDVIGNLMISDIPFKTPQTVTLTSDRPLTKWDKLEKRNGQWGWVYKSAEKVLDGTEDYVTGSGNYISDFSSNCYTVISDMVIDGRDNAFMNRLSNIDYSWTLADAIGFSKNRDQLHVRISNADLGTTGESSASEVVAAMKSYIAQQYEEGNPFIFLYETTEETFVPLSSSEQEQMNALYTFRPTTVLSNDCECNMSLTYKTKKSLQPVSGGV